MYKSKIIILRVPQVPSRALKVGSYPYRNTNYQPKKLAEKLRPKLIFLQRSCKEKSFITLTPRQSDFVGGPVSLNEIWNSHF
jgi:hypothetical protein